jgi:hypothetical protein
MDYKDTQSRFFTREPKASIYKTPVRPGLVYGSQRWTLTQAADLRLYTFERKILRKTYGPVQEKGE